MTVYHRGAPWDQSIDLSAILSFHLLQGTPGSVPSRIWNIGGSGARVGKWWKTAARRLNQKLSCVSSTRDEAFHSPNGSTLRCHSLA